MERESAPHQHILQMLISLVNLYSVPLKNFLDTQTGAEDEVATITLTVRYHTMRSIETAAQRQETGKAPKGKIAEKPALLKQEASSAADDLISNYPTIFHKARKLNCLSNKCPTKNVKNILSAFHFFFFKLVCAHGAGII